MRKEHIQLVTVAEGPRRGHWRTFVSGGKQFFLNRIGDLGKRIRP